MADNFKWLDCRSDPGLFVAENDGVVFWIVRNSSGHFAIQLDAKDGAPGYSYHSLTDRKLARGTNFGSVTLRVFMAAPGDLADRSGVVIASGTQLHLTVEGKPGRLRLNDGLDRYDGEPTYHPAWALELADNSIHSYMNPMASHLLNLSLGGDLMARSALAESRILNV